MPVQGHAHHPLCVLQGGLPSFFDVSSSFSAGRVAEDSLIDQLAAAGKQLVGGRRDAGG